MSFIPDVKPAVVAAVALAASMQEAAAGGQEHQAGGGADAVPSADAPDAGPAPKEER